MDEPKVIARLRRFGGYYLWNYEQTEDFKHQEILAAYDAMKADRDAWKAKAEAATRAPEPVHYKGVTYQGGKWWRGTQCFGTAAHVITADDSDCGDADHAALMALKDAAERQPTLEGVVRNALGSLPSDNIVAKVSDAIRTAFPHLDAPPKGDGQAYWLATGILLRLNPNAEPLLDVLGVLTQISDALTAPRTVAEHVAALVRLGATLIPQAHAVWAPGRSCTMRSEPQDVLVLPVERRHD